MKSFEKLGGQETRKAIGSDLEKLKAWGTDTES